MAVSPRRRLAFTLVELLVVIAIIGTLVALLLPAVQNARARARQLTCLNHIKQLATAMINYDSSKGQLPGCTQFIKRGSLEYASITYTSPQFQAGSTPFNATPTPSQLQGVSAFSWATMLLSRLERQDIWDGIVQPPVAMGKVALPPLSVFICPSDRDVASQPDLPGLTYIVNCGAWDRDSGGNFVAPPNGDTIDNGVFFSNADFARAGATAPIPRISGISDGSGTTLMISENIDKSYDADSNGAPAFGWFGSDLPSAVSEQQLGMVWVDPNNNTTSPPQPVGVSINDQEAINRDTNTSGPQNFPSTIPRYARPASAHANGVNVAFCDGHGTFLRDDIDYLVYQQLMTPNGRKCVDPVDHSMNLGNNQSIYLFRAAAPLAEKDYQ